jgi:hypothetical protein
VLIRCKYCFQPFLVAFSPAFLNFNVQQKNMAKLDANSTLKRLRNRYRLVVMNEDTYEEVVKFKLSRLSVYVFLSTVFVVLVGLIIALLVFTPLKYYLPGTGYGNARQIREYQMLKMRTDSMEQALQYKQKYYDDLHKVLDGKLPVLDTNKLQLPKVENIVE